MKLSIAAPWYKSPQSVLALHKECLLAFDAMPDFAEIEFVFVEDGGNDGTWEALAELAAKDPRVKAARLSRNFGQHHALTACLDICSGDWAVVMDCDMQDKPSEIPKLWEKAREGCDMVCARRGKRQDSWLKSYSSRCFIRLFNFLSGLNYDPEIANFRIMSRKVVDSWRNMREGVRNLPAQLEWLGFKTGFVNVSHGSSYRGKSSYSITRLFALAFNTIIAYSSKPLRLFCALGFGIALISFLLAVWIIIRKIAWDIPILGWSSLMVSIWFIGGMVIGSLGIIGVYVGRIYEETKKRPIYVIDERINF